MKTFANDHALSALPIPQLPSTCAGVADLVAPLVDASTRAATAAALEEFSRPGGAGEVLQEALRGWRGSLPGNASWLRPFWDDMYTSWRGTLPLEMNYFLQFSSERWGGALALPRFVRGLCHIFQQFARGEFEPEPSRNGFQAMDQMRSCIFTRVPNETQDTLGPVHLTSPFSAAVVCRGHWFVLPLQSVDGVITSESGLAEAFAAIRKEAAALPEDPAVAAMTGTTRATAAKIRAEVQSTLLSRVSLAAIEKSLFVVCLDDAHTCPSDLGLRLLGGDAACRWFDKSLQIIATENDGLGANFEHAGCDAGIWLYLLTKVDEAIMGEAVAAGGPARESRLLQWDVPAPVAERLAALRADFAARVQGIDLACREFPSLSRETVKSLGCSPDAFLQVAFQVAQYRIFGKLRSAYEAVAMRGFAEGRTECARPSTGDALAFAVALEQGADSDTLRELFRQAERTHLARLVRCQRGIGVERHMYGLYTMYSLYGKQLGIDALPAIFSDAGWKTLKHDALSTSGIGAPFIVSFGFGPVVEDGYGLGYGTSKDKTSLVVTSLKASGLEAERFSKEFLSAAETIVALLQVKQPATSATA